MEANTISTKSTRRYDYCMKALYRALDIDDDDYFDDGYQEAISFSYMGQLHAVFV